MFLLPTLRSATGRLVAEEIAGLVAAVVDNDLLKHDAGMAGLERECVLTALTYRQLNLLHDHAAGDGGIEVGVHVGLTVYKRLVEVYHHGV